MSEWNVKSSKYILKDKWISLRADTCTTPAGVLVDPYYVLEYPTWINILAITCNNEAVLIHQYRHGVRRRILELPGGAVDDRDQSIIHAVRRELLEETGYSVEQVTEVGSIYASPSNHTNKIYCYVGTGAKKIAAPILEDTEEIKVELMPLKDLLKAAYEGQISHPHHLATIFFANESSSIFDA